LHVINLQFACNKHGIVFNIEDMQRLAMTLKKNVWNGQEFTSSVYGTGKVNAAIADTGILWIGLGKHDQEVLDLVKQYIAGKNFRDLPEYKWNWYMWAISMLMVIGELQHEAS